MACLYERMLGSQWQLLPAPLRELHATPGTYAGMARVVGGNGWLAKLLRVMFGFPGAAETLPLRVILSEQGGGERWERRFGSQAFHSHLSIGGPPGAALLVERFGAFRFLMRVPVNAQGLRMEIIGARFLGMPWPRLLTPRTDTREYVDEQGRFCFDVAVTVPLAGLLFRYQGWLLPDVSV